MLTMLSPSQEAHLKTEFQSKVSYTEGRLSQTAGHVNVAINISHTHTQTHTQHTQLSHDLSVIFSNFSLLNCAYVDTSMVDLSTQKFCSVLNSVLNIEGLSVTWA